MIQTIKRIKYSFDEWHDLIFECQERRANRELLRKKDIWFEFTAKEFKYPQEFNPCPQRCYPSESISLTSVTIETPVVVATKDGNAKEATFAKRFRLVFNMTDMDVASINVTTWPDKGTLFIEATSIKSKTEEDERRNIISVKAKRKMEKYKWRKNIKYYDGYESDDSDDDESFAESEENLLPYIYFFGRKFRVSSEVDLEGLEVSLTADKWLIVEAAILDDEELLRRKRLDRMNTLIIPKENKLLLPEFNRSIKSRKMPFGTMESPIEKRAMPPTDLPLVVESISLSENSLAGINSIADDERSALTPNEEAKGGPSDEQTSPTSSNGSSGGKEMKVGVPIFRDEGTVRKMYLTLNIGEDFKDKDVIVQVLKENRIHISAKRKVKDSFRSKTIKFSRCYDLCEKVNPFTLTAGFTRDKKLLLTALSKDGLHHDNNSEPSSTSSFENDEDDVH